MMVEIWSDVVCPWCAIGRSRLDAALADFDHADGVAAEVLRSFELDPSAPVGGSKPMVEVLAEKYGVPRDEAVRMMARTEGLAADEGLVMHMATTRHSNTVDAHRLLHLALATGGPDVQARLNAALVTAHFERGEDVGDHAVLRRTALAAGLDAAAVEDVLAGDRYAAEVAADVQQARAYGATGVPFFVIHGRFGISGAQPTEVFAQALAQAWSESVSA